MRSQGCAVGDFLLLVLGFELGICRPVPLHEWHKKICFANLSHNCSCLRLVHLTIFFRRYHRRQRNAVRFQVTARSTSAPYYRRSLVQPRALLHMLTRPPAFLQSSRLLALQAGAQSPQRTGLFTILLFSTKRRRCRRYMLLTKDVSWKVRRTVAASICHVAKALNADIIVSDLFPVFDSFCRSGLCVWSLI